MSDLDLVLRHLERAQEFDQSVTISAQQGEALLAGVRLARAALAEMVARCSECGGGGVLHADGGPVPCEGCDAARLALEGKDWRKERAAREQRP